MADDYGRQNSRLTGALWGGSLVVLGGLGAAVLASAFPSLPPLRAMRPALGIALIAVLFVILQLRARRSKAARELQVREERLRAAARRAEASERAAAEFLANMSHEIRTPLTGVIGVAELLARSPLNAEQADLVETIRTAGAMLDRLLLDVLDMSKMEEGQLSIAADPLSLQAELTTLAALWRPKAEARGLEFTLEVDPSAAANVLGDGLRLKQILSNLLSNAIKFTERGSVRLSVTREAETCVFRVQDSGIGFDAETKARLFGRFQQADGTIARRFGGSGLGLAISHKLATLMGGDLDADSEPGRGATFTLTLPLPLAPDTEAQVDAQQAFPVLRVLVADDHNINRKVAKLALEMLGVGVTLAEDGAEALARHSAEAFDVILMDMQMPKLDGLAATREIRRLEAASGRPRTPIIMLTANSGPEYVRRSLDAGADAYVSKPLRPDELIQQINTLLASSPARAAA